MTQSASAEALSTDQAVARAAAQSPTLRAALLDLAAARQALAAEKGARQPVLSASVSGEHQESISSGGGAAGRNAQNGLTASATLNYTTDVGTSLEVGASADTSFRDSGSNSATASPSTGPVITGLAYVQARQPLLRGAGTDSVLAPIVQAKAAANAAALQRDDTASQTAADVLSAFWELWYAERAVGVEEQGLTAAKKQVDDARARAETLGTGSRIDVLQFSTQAASIADALSQARATLSTRGIGLGRTLGMEPVISAELRAVGDPSAGGDLPSIDAVVKAVTERSSELAAMRADLESTRARVATAEDADQPRLDAFTKITLGTLWADDDLPGLRLPGGRPAFSVLGGIELELPLGGGRMSADAARARSQFAAAEARYKARLDAVTADATSLCVNLKASMEQVHLAAETAKIAEELAEAERARLRIGTGTASDVVKAEQTAREAELRKLRALVMLMESRLSLDHATGALLDRYASVLGGKSS